MVRKRMVIFFTFLRSSFEKYYIPDEFHLLVECIGSHPFRVAGEFVHQDGEVVEVGGGKCEEFGYW